MLIELMTERRLVLQMCYPFEPGQREKLIQSFGAEFYNKLDDKIAACSAIWELSGLRFIPSYSANCVFSCHSGVFGESILKISNYLKEVTTEYNALREYNGRRFCEAFDADTDNGIIIEERILPGITLRDEKALDKRLESFCSLYNGLHIESAKPEIYPTYMQWVSRITDYMSGRHDRRELYLHMKKAEDICISLWRQYSKRLLLHGDFHHDNILLGSGLKYIIIDPKGVIGDPIFDVPRFILNELDDEFRAEDYERISKIIEILGEKLDIPDIVARQCFYIETAMSECWNVESGAVPEEYARQLNNVAFAEAIMHGKKRLL